MDDLIPAEQGARLSVRWGLSPPIPLLGIVLELCVCLGGGEGVALLTTAPHGGHSTKLPRGARNAGQCQRARSAHGDSVGTREERSTFSNKHPVL